MKSVSIQLLDAMLHAQAEFISGGDPRSLFQDLLADVLAATGSIHGTIVEFVPSGIELWAGSNPDLHLVQCLKIAQRTGSAPPHRDFVIHLCPSAAKPAGAIVLSGPVREPENLATLLSCVAGLFRGAQARREGRRNAEALRLRDRALASITSAVAILDVTQPGYPIIYCNAALETMAGYRSAEILGRPFSFMEGPATSLETMREMKAALAENRSLEATVTHYHRDGTPFWNQLSICPVKSEDGAVRYFVTVGDNISWKIDSEAELRRARDEAEAAVRYKSQLLANISHEIRTPMNAVIGMTGVLLDTRLTAEQRDYVEIIRSGGEGLLNIVNEILDFSKIESGKLSLESEQFDLRACIESALDLVAAAAAAKSLELGYRIPSDTPELWLGDVTRLRQILINLLGNSVKFTDRGSIQLSVSSQSGEGSLKKLHFQVSDTGVGISQHKIGEIFKPFQQADASTTRKHGGTGLGLSISMQLAELMDGKMWADSTPGVGSTFHFTIVLKALPGRGDARFRDAQPSLSGLRALVIDRSSADQEILRQHLTSWNIIPAIYPSLAAASADMVTGQTFDFAIVDNDLPALSPQALLKLIGDIPLLVLYSLGRRQIGLAPLSQGSEKLQELEKPKLTWHAKPIKPSHVCESLLNWFHESHDAPPQKAPRPMNDPDFARQHPFKILVAEDNLVNQKLSLLLLSRLGYQADIAGNGLEALEALKHRLYDVIFMDMHMPEMDGIEATRLICESFTPDMRPWIIALTANAMDSDRTTCAQAGMRDFISKPIHADELRASLERVPRSWVAPDFIEEMLQAEPEPVLELVNLFLDDTAANILSLHEAIAAGTSNQLLGLLHGLKGSCRQIGALKMGEIAERMEGTVQSSPNAALDASEMDCAFQTLRVEMEARLRSLGLDTH